MKQILEVSVEPGTMPSQAVMDAWLSVVRGLAAFYVHKLVAGISLTLGKLCKT